MLSDQPVCTDLFEGESLDFRQGLRNDALPPPCTTNGIANIKRCDIRVAADKSNRPNNLTDALELYEPIVKGIVVLPTLDLLSNVIVRFFEALVCRPR